MDNLITIDKIRISQKTVRPVTIGYNVYIKEYFNNSGTLSNIQTKTISNSVVAPVTTEELFGSLVVDISSTTFTNRTCRSVDRTFIWIYLQ